jgi:hypothetical protein
MGQLPIFWFDSGVRRDLKMVRSDRSPADCRRNVNLMLVQSILKVNNLMEQPQPRLMLKIIIGSAWVDGHLEPAEVQYLQTLLERCKLTHAPELLALLEAPVSLRQTELWMADYLVDTTETERQRLLAAIGKLIIADDTVLPQEHTLLDDYYTLMAAIPARPEETPTLVETVGKFVRKVARMARNLSAGH